MTARILSTIVFWLLMIPLIVGALLLVGFVYLPFVALKAVWLAVTGRLHEAIGSPDDQDSPEAVRPHIG